LMVGHRFESQATE
jgi:hypothetical protein